MPIGSKLFLGTAFAPARRSDSPIEPFSSHEMPCLEWRIVRIPDGESIMYRSFSPALPLVSAVALFTLLFTSPLLFCAASVAQGQDSSAASRLSDEEISQAIQADIQDAARIAGGKTNVTSDAGLVTLSGTVTSLLDKQMATTIAKRTRGVSSVLNQLIVVASDRKDDDIRSDVEKVLRINDSVDEPRIAVDVSRSEVSLTGKVDSLAEKRIADLAASGVSGVASVNNQITVGLRGNRTDDDIAEEIRGLIVHSVYLDDSSVNVNVIDHVAKLSGFVPSLEAKDRVEQIAEIWGVSAVDVSGVQVDPDKLDDSQRRALCECDGRRHQRGDRAVFPFGSHRVQSH